MINAFRIFVITCLPFFVAVSVAGRMVKPGATIPCSLSGCTRSSRTQQTGSLSTATSTSTCPEKIIAINCRRVHAGLASCLGMLSISIPAFVLSRRLGWGAASSILTPIIFLCLFYAIFRSAWLTTRQNGVSWRGTHYSLAALREGSVK